MEKEKRKKHRNPIFKGTNQFTLDENLRKIGDFMFALLKLIDIDTSKIEQEIISLKEKHEKSCPICSGKVSGFCDASLLVYPKERKEDKNGMV